MKTDGRSIMVHHIDVDRKELLQNLAKENGTPIFVIDTVETYRDMISGMREIYLSILSNRMNEVMKVLTIIATIFIPLTFIAGIYGMNFSYMPELGWIYGYPVIILIMIAISGVMVYYFRIKKWL